MMDTAFTAAQMVAPTHAHRFAPESATGNLVIGPLIGVVDRVRDALWSTSNHGRSAPR